MKEDGGGREGERGREGKGGTRESALRHSSARESALRESTIVRGTRGLSTVIGEMDSVPLSE